MRNEEKENKNFIIIYTHMKKVQKMNNMITKISFFKNIMLTNPLEIVTMQWYKTKASNSSQAIRRLFCFAVKIDWEAG